MQRSRSSAISGEIGIGFSNVRFGNVHARVAGPVAERQVLQRALAALVADRAVERVVDEDELEHRLLALGGLVRGGAVFTTMPSCAVIVQRGLQLRHALDLDEAHAAGADRGPEARLVAEDRDLDPGRRAPASTSGVPFGTWSSRPSMVSVTVASWALMPGTAAVGAWWCWSAGARKPRATSRRANGQPPWSMCAWNSSRNLST